MNSKALWSVTAFLLGLLAAPLARAASSVEPVYRALDSYSEKDKAFIKQRLPQLESIEKQISELGSKPMNRATVAMIEELEAKKKQIVSELTEHEFRLSTDIAGYATNRSKDAEGRLKQLRGEGGPTGAAGGPALPRELAEFEERVKQERAALEEELKNMPPDAEEVARKELQEKLRKISNEEDQKIRQIPPGPKKLKRDAFEARVNGERDALKKKLGIAEAPGAAAPQGEQAPV